MGHIDGKIVSESVPDFKDRFFYVSGSHGVVVAMEKVLSDLGVSRARIKTDFFPGYV